MRRLPIQIVTALVLVSASAEVAGAQCSFDRASKAKKAQLAIVQVSKKCGGPTCASFCLNNFMACTTQSDCPGSFCVDQCTLAPHEAPSTPNAVTEFGTPSCSPPLTPRADNGDPANAWRFGPKGKGAIQLSASKKPPLDPLNPVGDTVDTRVQLKLSGIVSGSEPDGANGSGTLWVTARETTDDRVGGDMVVVDYFLFGVFNLANGKVTYKTTLDVMRNDLNVPGFAPCTSLELRTIHVMDGNQTVFGTMGLFLPPL